MRLVRRRHLPVWQKRHHRGVVEAGCHRGLGETPGQYTWGSNCHSQADHQRGDRSVHHARTRPSAPHDLSQLFSRSLAGRQVANTICDIDR